MSQQSIYTVKSLSPRNNPAWTPADTYDEATAKAKELKASGHINVKIYPNIEAIVTAHTPIERMAVVA